MATKEFKSHIKKVLRDSYFRDDDDYVYVSDNSKVPELVDEYVHVYIISPKFAGKWMEEKQDLITSVLINNLKQSEWSKVSLSVGFAPEELEEVF